MTLWFHQVLQVWRTWPLLYAVMPRARLVQTTVPGMDPCSGLRTLCRNTGRQLVFRCDLVSKRLTGNSLSLHQAFLFLSKRLKFTLCLLIEVYPVLAFLEVELKT